MLYLYLIVLAPWALVGVLYLLNAINAFMAMWLDCGKRFPSYELVKECCIKEDCRNNFKVKDYLGLFMI